MLEVGSCSPFCFSLVTQEPFVGSLLKPRVLWKQRAWADSPCLISFLGGPLRRWDRRNNACILILGPVKTLPSAAEGTLGWEIILGFLCVTGSLQKGGRKVKGRHRDDMRRGPEPRNWGPLEAKRRKEVGSLLEPPEKNPGLPTPWPQPVRLILDF